ACSRFRRTTGCASTTSCSHRRWPPRARRVRSIGRSARVRSRRITLRSLPSSGSARCSPWPLADASGGPRERVGFRAPAGCCREQSGDTPYRLSGPRAVARASEWGSERPRALRAVGRYGLPFVRIELELLNLAGERVAAPAQPLRGFHTTSAGMLQRAQDQRPLELLFQPLADRALATGERLRELPIECLLPIALALARTRTGALKLGRKSGAVDPYALCHHGQPVADILDLTHVGRKRERRQIAEGVIG